MFEKLILLSEVKRERIQLQPNEIDLLKVPQYKFWYRKVTTGRTTTLSVALNKIL